MLITDDLAKLIAYSLVRWAKQKPVITIQSYNKAYWQSIMKMWGPAFNLPEYSRAAQSNLVPTSHMWLFKLLKNKYMKSSIPGLHQPATFQQPYMASCYHTGQPSPQPGSWQQHMPDVQGCLTPSLWATW